APARVLVITGALVAAGGFVWQSTITPNSSYLIGIVGPGLVFSFGVGVLNTPLTTIVTSGIPAHEAGAASGLMNTTKQVGGALGLSALVTVASGGPEGLDYRTAFLVTAGILLVAAAAATLLPRGARVRLRFRAGERRWHRRPGALAAVRSRAGVGDGPRVRRAVG